MPELVWTAWESWFRRPAVSANIGQEWTKTETVRVFNIPAVNDLDI